MTADQEGSGEGGGVRDGRKVGVREGRRAGVREGMRAEWELTLST